MSVIAIDKYGNIGSDFYGTKSSNIELKGQEKLGSIGSCFFAVTGELGKFGILREDLSDVLESNISVDFTIQRCYSMLVKKERAKLFTEKCSLIIFFPKFGVACEFTVHYGNFLYNKYQAPCAFGSGAQAAMGALVFGLPVEYGLAAASEVNIGCSDKFSIYCKTDSQEYDLEASNICRGYEHTIICREDVPKLSELDFSKFKAQ